MSDAAIETQGLVREFKKGPRAVDGIDLRVEPGEVYGFLGPNGAGKSTTVHMLTTLLPPTAGRAWVAGHDIVEDGAGRARHDRRGAPGGRARPVPDRPRAPAAPDRAPRHDAAAEARERSEQLLERVGLVQAADRRVGGYSGGMKRRLDLALALVHRPRILFLDEPTTGLDPQSRSALWEEVQRLAADRGVTVFLTTQYLEEADVLADRVGIIDRGQIVAEGTPEALKDEIGRPSVEAIPQDPEQLEHMKEVLARFGETVAGSPKGASVRLAGGDAQLAEVVRALDAESIEIQELQLHAPTLDDVFLAKTGRSLEGEAGAAEEAEPAERRVSHVLLLAQRSVVRTLRQPAMVVPVGRLPAAAALDQQQRARQRHAPARLPDGLLLPVRASRSRSSRARCSRR